VEEKANSRTITEPEIAPSAQPSQRPNPVPEKATTAIGGKRRIQPLVSPPTRPSLF
jgi:hypothetical protein